MNEMDGDEVMLALVGSGEYLPAMEPMDRELISRLKDPPRVVCLPTAAGNEGPERIAYWSRLGVEHFTRLEAEVEAVPVIDKASANDAILAKTIARANFVYLSGGRPSYLHETLEGSLAWDAILSVLEDGGLLAGCSAGAMIMGETFYGFTDWKPGFNLLPGFTIIPHYGEFPESRIRSIRQSIGEDLTMLCIERDTILLKSEGQYEVVGSGGVTVWDKSSKTRYTQGPLLPAVSEKSTSVTPACSSEAGEM
jgi:cyanophycinase